MDKNSTNASHIVISVRGIRDFGLWQERLGTLLRERDPNLEYVAYDTGWFDVISFCVPYARNLVVKRFREWLVDNTEPDQEIDLVAHSFGTLIATNAVKTLPTESTLRVRVLILSGSVLPTSFRWGSLLKNRIGRVINECGIRDRPLVASQFFVFGTGMAGKVGFPGGSTERFRNRYHDFGHGGYFQGEFMQNHWVDLLADENATVPEIDQRPKHPGWSQRLWYTILNFASPAKLAAYTSVPLLIIALFTSLYLQKKNSELSEKLIQQQLSTSRQAVRFSQLAEATRLSFRRRDSGSVLSALLSTLANEKFDSSIQHALVVQNKLRLVDPHRQGPQKFRAALATLGNSLDELASELDNDAIYWHVKGLMHCQFIYEDGNRDEQMELFQTAFANAATRYERLSNKTSNSLPYLLAMLDYGSCLWSIDERGQAATVLTRALRRAGETSESTAPVPVWVLSELHAALAEVRRHCDHEEAVDHIQQAIRLIESDEELTGLLAIYRLRLAWFKMDRWDDSAALPQFNAAATLLSGIARDDLSFLNEWLHARHGRILADYYATRDADQAVNAFDDLIATMQHVHDAAFSTHHPELRLLSDRRLEELRGRIFNAYERRADVQLDIGDREATRLAADSYLRAAQYAANVGGDAEKLNRWSKRQARMLYRAAAAHAAVEDLDQAREALAQADNVACDLWSPTERNRFGLNRELSTRLLQLMEADHRTSVADKAVAWTLDAIAGYSDQRPRRDDVEFTLFCGTKFVQYASPERRADLLNSLDQTLLADLNLTWSKPQATARPTPEFQQQTTEPIHSKWRYRSVPRTTRVGN
ncbi:hypothetical protein Mal4_38280 [Maioricimonas rarisocia]|uniref:Alpha/beta hydrolase family protein n=1 Tax=Maioricimonas rarisocia TaxID=2528026 RepID=A0A517ZAG0_9PLAN|nr:hypothetical protein [Maioricimonas rarisocia]QDU39483.1 hypothetical protein Mal4_38280 [Maioricimonas rarisocia]